MPDDAALAQAQEAVRLWYDSLDEFTQSCIADRAETLIDSVTVALRVYGDARAREQREQDARIAEAKVICELHAIDSGERDPLCAITLSTAAVCLTHGRDIAAAIRAAHE